MPFVSPNLAFAPAPVLSGTAALKRGPSVTLQSTSILDCSMLALPFLGTGSSLCSCGFNAGVAPIGAKILAVSADCETLENATSCAASGYSRASAGLRVVVEEFAATGSFLRSIVGATSSIFDLTASFVGFGLRTDEVHGIAATIRVRVAPHRLYRVWFELVQSVETVAVAGYAHAVTNCNVCVGKPFFEFIR